MKGNKYTEEMESLLERTQLSALETFFAIRAERQKLIRIATSVNLISLLLFPLGNIMLVLPTANTFAYIVGLCVNHHEKVKALKKLKELGFTFQ